MKSVVLLSDVHLVWDRPIARLDDIIETQFKKLSYVFDWARKNDACIIQAGDLTDVPRSWRLLPLMIDFFKTYKDVTFYTIYGQHNMYMYEGNKEGTILGVLNKANLIIVPEENGRAIWGNGRQSIRLYSCSYGQEVPRAKSERYHYNILVIHKMITDQPLWRGHEDYIDAKDFIEEYNEYDLILCGDAHKYFQVYCGERQIINAGPMLRLRANDVNHHPGFFVLDCDTKRMRYLAIPHSKSEDVLTRDHIDMAEEKEEALKEFINKIKLQNVDFGMSFKENLLVFIKENEVPKDIREEIALVMGGE